jgi:hypothetical protein
MPGQDGKLDQRQLKVLVDSVQQSCDIADARYAGDDLLCPDLLRMWSRL